VLDAVNTSAFTDDLLGHANGCSLVNKIVKNSPTKTRALTYAYIFVYTQTVTGSLHGFKLIMGSQRARSWMVSREP
jgi:hypothetical protein